MLVLLAIVAGLATPGQEAGPQAPRVETLPSVEVNAPPTHGVVEVECEAVRGGRLRNCVIISETPAGYGFGEVALESASRSRLSRRAPETEDGKVRFTARFRLPD